MQRRTRVYVAGPISQGDEAVNVAVGMSFCDLLFDLGYSPFNPFLSSHWHEMTPRTWEEWLDYDKPWLLASDAVLRLPGPSKGADLEEEWARSEGIPVFLATSAFPVAASIEQFLKEVSPRR